MKRNEVVKLQGLCRTAETQKIKARIGWNKCPVCECEFYIARNKLERRLRR